MRGNVGANPNQEENYNPLLEYFKENINEMELFDEIVATRTTIQELETEIKQIKESQMKLFKIKYEVFKGNSTRESIHYDLMNAALFGNNVVL
jgi:hypothetical protein